MIRYPCFDWRAINECLPISCSLLTRHEYLTAAQLLSVGGSECKQPFVWYERNTMKHHSLLHVQDINYAQAFLLLWHMPQMLKRVRDCWQFRILTPRC